MSMTQNRERERERENEQRRKFSFLSFFLLDFKIIGHQSIHSYPFAVMCLKAVLATILHLFSLFFSQTGRVVM